MKRLRDWWDEQSNDSRFFWGLMIYAPTVLAIVILISHTKMVR